MRASPSWARRPGSSTRRPPVATSLKADLIDKLPTSRTIVAAANLTPGVQNTGANGGLSINGAMSFESLYVVNGVVVNENIRGQPIVLFIEDALQETTITHRGDLRRVRAVPGRSRAGHHQVGRQRVLGLLPHHLRQQRLGGPHPVPERQPHGQAAAHPGSHAGRADPEGQALVLRSGAPHRRPGDERHHLRDQPELREHPQPEALRGQAHLRPQLQAHLQGGLHEDQGHRGRQLLRQHHGLRQPA